ncbi:MAG: hypothetical protein CL840_06680 [Crocinitomicaceae bacterium]|nr:hypothetical protein [Crocinitomicaceae bacterium]|tara:strand:- start:260 stop:952 length:693 start_codon:yes stop_codon:yes gene_type:complete
MGKIKRLRLVGGPNGSGKSTLIADLSNKVHLHNYYNADDLERLLHEGISLGPLKYFDYENANSYLSQHFLSIYYKSFKFESKQKWHGEINSYLASALAEYLRYETLRQSDSLTFETVMSHHSKLKFFEDAKALGYRNYLYFITTQDPKINVDRVRQRVQLGGHPVNEIKIVDRYWRSLENLLPAILLSDRAYLFDNSGKQYVLIAEVTRGSRLEIKGNFIPRWLDKYLLR